MLVATLILLTTLEATFAGYAGSSSNEVGNGYGYGYSGSFSGTGGNIPNIPQPPIPNFAEFGDLLNGYFDSFRKYHEHFLQNRVPHSFTITSSSSLSPSSSSRVQASSSIQFLPTRSSRIQQQAQQAAQNPGYAPGFSSYGAPTYTADGKGGNGGAAIASASLGPQGGYQGAAVYPENPNAPNVFTRFGGSEAGPSGGGSYGVFTSSVSSSSDLDGKVHNFHRASTTINDNGKISTYTVKNP